MCGVSPTSKTDRHDITETLLKAVVLQMIPVFRLLISFINFVALELNKIANLTKRLGQAIGFERRFQQC
jgi:hypothetical protein